MPTNPADIVTLIDDIQKDLTYAKAKFATLREYFAAMGVVETRPHKCAECELSFRSSQELRDHMINVHEWKNHPTDDQAKEQRKQHAEQLRSQFAEMTGAAGNNDFWEGT